VLAFGTGRHLGCGCHSCCQISQPTDLRRLTLFCHVVGSLVLLLFRRIVGSLGESTLLRVAIDNDTGARRSTADDPDATVDLRPLAADTPSTVKPLTKTLTEAGPQLQMSLSHDDPDATKDMSVTADVGKLSSLFSCSKNVKDITLI